MILFEKYSKSIIGKEVYNTVTLADVIDINNEKYFVVSGYLFDKKDANIESFVESDYIKDTFFKRNENDEKSDIDAYYLIYNIDKKQVVDNKSKFILENNLFKNIRLDRTRCEEIQIGGEVAYKVKAKNSEYVFVDVKDDKSSYLIMKDTKKGLYPENLISFNEAKNKVNMSDDILNLQKMVNQIEKNNLLKNVNSTIKFMEKSNIEKNKEEEIN